MNARIAIVLGIVSIVVAGVLLAIALPRLGQHDTHRAAALTQARAGCAAFDDVYEATRPGTPTDGDLLARRLEVAIDRLQRAAADDPKWRPLSDALVRTGNAVNAGNTNGAAAGIADVHARCLTAVSRSS